MSTDQNGRDLPLGFHWSTIDYDRIHALGVPHHGDRHRNRARNSLLTEAVLAHEAGRWVSYSRRKEHYVGLWRYHGAAYSYANVVSSVDEGERLGLLEIWRSSPHHRGTQSKFRATPRLIEGLAEALFRYELHGCIRLKNADKQYIGF